MPPKRKTRSSGEEGAAAAAGSSGAARRRTQPGIAEALATAGERAASAGAAADLVLEQPLQRDLLGRHLLENLQSEGDKYLQAW